MTWSVPQQVLPIPFLDVDVVLHTEADGFYTDIAFIDASGRWQLSQADIVPVQPLLWCHRPEIPGDVRAYIQDRLSRPQPAVGANNTGNNTTGFYRTQTPRSGEVSPLAGVVDWPPQAALESGDWWCFTTSQLHSALNAWRPTITDPDTRNVCAAAVTAFLRSPSVAKLRRH